MDTTNLRDQNMFSLWCEWKSNYELHRVSQGFLWDHRLQVVLVLLQFQQFQVVQPLPFLHALLEDPATETQVFFCLILDKKRNI